MIAFVPSMFLFLLVSALLQEFTQPLLLDLPVGSIQIFFLLSWVVFYALALALPYSLMLLFAFLNGLFWDLRIPLGTQDSEFLLGGSILLFALFGSLVQGVRPLFRKGHWLLPVVMVGVSIFLHRLAEVLLLSFTRGAFLVSIELGGRLLGTSVAAMLLTPFALYVISRTARWCGYRLEFEQMMFRRNPYGNQI